MNIWSVASKKPTLPKQNLFTSCFEKMTKIGVDIVPSSSIENNQFPFLKLPSIPLLSISFLLGRCRGRVNDGNSHSEAQINSVRQK